MKTIYIYFLNRIIQYISMFCLTNTIYSDRMKAKVDLYNRKIITAFCPDEDQERNFYHCMQQVKASGK